MKYGIEKVLVKWLRPNTYIGNVHYQNGDVGLIGNGEVLTRKQLLVCLAQELAWHRNAIGDQSANLPVVHV